MKILIITIAYLVYLALYGVRLVHYLHMFQLNSYKPDRYYRWEKENRYRDEEIRIRTFNTAYIMISIMLYVRINSHNINTLIYFVLITLVISALVDLFIYSNKKAKIPPVFTPRFKRLLAVSLMIFVVISLLLLTVFSFEFVLIIESFFIIFSHLMIYLSYYILRPLENRINKTYYKEAEENLNKHKDLKVIGVTGSYGKTSTKFILEKILEEKYQVLATPLSYNTTMGVVRTVREKLKLNHQVFIVEMGAKQEKDIEEIAKLVKPKYSIITSIGPQHLETFKTIENVIKTKFELALSTSDAVFVNIDNPHIARGMERYPDINYITFGQEKSADYRIVNIKTDVSVSEFEIVNKQFDSQERWLFKTSLLGDHNISNIASAIGLAHYMGLDYASIKKAVISLRPTPHRLELKRNGDYYILDDAFNSNPIGAANALKVLGAFKKGKKIIITPGMIELGQMDQEIHYNLGKQISQVVDYAILVGKEKTRQIYEGLVDSNFDEEKIMVVDDVYKAFSTLHEIVEKDDVILIENDLPDNYERIK